MKNNLPLGRFGEDLAAKHLKSLGFKIIDRNFRSRVGEIDIIAINYTSPVMAGRSIIAQDKDVLVFFEVKTRSGNKYGKPEEAITPWKLKSIVRTAQFYKMLHPKLPESLRVDAIVIELSPTGEVKRLEHLQNITC